jgi:hypothetical protein
MCRNFFAYSDGNATTLSTLFGRQAMRRTEVGTPVASSDGKNGEFGNDDGGADGGCDFFRRLDTKTNVTFRVSNDNDGLESSTLTGAGLLLHGFDLTCFCQHSPSW